ncbi:MAG TPA: GAF domain-containing protein, partial [Prosthecobacter sp.]|nr:GAF domain-containing protein [Prosthecobacter sp.]
MLASPSSLHSKAGSSEEEKRLDALRAYQILDSPAERAFDELTQLAAQICGIPIAGLTLLDEDRQWFKSIVGANLRETPRRIAFSDHVVREGRPLIVPDATMDARFADNPQVTGEPHIRFYAAVPLISSGGHSIGALAVVDLKPRRLEAAQLRALQMVANQIMDQLELRMNRLQLEHALEEKDQLRRQLAQDRNHLCEAQRMAGVGSWRRSLSENRLTWTDEVFRIFGYTPGAIRPTFEVFFSHVHPDDREALSAARERTLKEGLPLDIE